VQAGHRDIEVVDHLDLRDLRLLSVPLQFEGQRHTIYVFNSTRSIRVRTVQLQNCFILQKRTLTSSPVFAAMEALQVSAKLYKTQSHLRSETSMCEVIGRLTQELLPSKRKRSCI
jgi:hypothetical protein